MPKHDNGCGCSLPRRDGGATVVVVITSMLISMFSASLPAGAVSCVVNGHDPVIQCTAEPQQPVGHDRQQNGPSRT